MTASVIYTVFVTLVLVISVFIFLKVGRTSDWSASTAVLAFLTIASGLVIGQLLSRLLRRDGRSVSDLIIDLTAAIVGVAIAAATLTFMKRR